MALLPAAGTAAYNGFTFNASAKTRVSARFEYDRADRTVVAVVYTFAISTYVTESVVGAGADADVADARLRLSTPGAAFTFTGQGFGSLSVNVAGVKDVLWGPKPRVLVLEPVGSKALWRLDWQVEVAVPECSAASYQRAVMAFNYEVSYAFDEQRLTTRVIDGYLEIPMTRADGSRRLPDTADAYRERIDVPVPIGFKRAAEVYRLSDDKRRLMFTISDRQMPTPESLPAGVVSATGRHHVETANTTDLSHYNNRLSARYTVAPGQDRKVAYDAFYALYYDRISFTLQQRTPDGNPVAVIPLSFSADEGLYESGLEIGFDLSWLITSSFDQVLQQAGLFRPVPGTDWQQWKTSLGETLGPRAQAGLRHRADEDVIVDLCLAASAPVGDDTQEPSLYGPGDSPVAAPPSDALLDYKIALETDLSPGAVLHTVLPRTKPERTSLTADEQADVDANGVESVYYDRATAGADPPADADVKVINRVADTLRVRLTGYAVRTWRPADPPKMIRFGDYTLIQDGRQRVRRRFLGVLGGWVPVYATVWSIPFRAVPRPRAKPRLPGFKVQYLKPTNGGFPVVSSRGYYPYTPGVYDLDPRPAD